MKYFPGLSAEQQEKFRLLELLYRGWNEKINVISRKDIDHLYERHVLHSLAIAKFISFQKGSKILDVGTGGGFPGIPLAIFFPDAQFHLADSIAKKINVVENVADKLALKNVTAEKTRVESLKGSFHFIVSRAVAPAKTIYEWTRHLIVAGDGPDSNSGWIFLKGGDLNEELRGLKRPFTKISINSYFDEDFFQEKYIVYFRK